MGITWNIVRVGISALIIVAVAECSKAYPRYGALLLSLPIVSILALTLSWNQHHDLQTISDLARDTVILVLLGLPLFVPLIFARKFGISFWPAMALGVALASISVGCWLLKVGD